MARKNSMGQFHEDIREVPVIPAEDIRRAAKCLARMGAEDLLPVLLPDCDPIQAQDSGD